MWGTSAQTSGWPRGSGRLSSSDFTATLAVADTFCLGVALDTGAVCDKRGRFGAAFELDALSASKSLSSTCAWLRFFS